MASTSNVTARSRPPRCQAVTSTKRVWLNEAAGRPMPKRPNEVRPLKRDDPPKRRQARSSARVIPAPLSSTAICGSSRPSRLIVIATVVAPAWSELSTSSAKAVARLV
jgi:hypothetical protein